METIKRILGFLRKHWRELFLLLSLILLVILCYQNNRLKAEIDNKEQTIVTMTEEHARDLNALQNELSINKQSAQVVQKEIIKAQMGLRQPDASYRQLYDTKGTLVSQVEERLATGDSTLPPEVLKDTDKTVVVEQAENKDFAVGVYKINTYRNWELGTGVGSHDGDTYIPVSLQRNYDKQHSVVAEVHFDINKKKINGYELQWKVHF